MTLAALRAAAAAEGLALTGAFAPGPDDGAPEGARTLVLLGYGGPEMWAAFRAGPEARDGGRHALDRWSRRVIGALAARFGGEALFPFGGPPYQPFLRWIYRAEPVHPSRLGMAIHPERGLWSGWRGAIALKEAWEAPPPARGENPCDPCPAPCLTACPVGAFTTQGYDVEACRAHLDSPEGASCRMSGCLARRACPVGRDFAHAPEQAAFHLEAFRIA